MKIKLSTIKESLILNKPQDEILKVCNKIYDMTAFIGKDYPGYKNWFYQKHLKETLNKNSKRDIIIACDEFDNICGVALIKQDEKEKKICTLFVDEKARGLGIGTMLIEKSFELLKTTKPLITFVDYKLPVFQRLIKKYDWQQTEIVKGLYNDENQELVYNGYLTPQKKNVDNNGE